VISVLIINYNAAPKMLRECLDSYLAQQEVELEIIVFDNGSKDTRILEKIAAQYAGQPVRFVYSAKNLGFAGGVNQALTYSQADYVFVSNFDIQVHPHALKHALKVMESKEHCAGVASKVFFMHDNNLFDNVGTAIDTFASAFNRGVGQYDVGQYDIIEQVFGVCFGSALLRRELFSPQAVGPLDSSYFMYYEDVDWCYRANLMGYRFYSCPDSRVFHYHSASVKSLQYAFKYRLIERNLLCTVVKNLEKRHLLRVLYRRFKSHIRNILFGRFRRATAQILLEFCLRMPRLYFKRRRVQKLRQVTDFEIFLLSYFEQPFFDPIHYRAILSLDALLLTYTRKFLLTNAAKYGHMVHLLKALIASNLKFHKGLVRRQLRDLLQEEPTYMHKYFSQFDDTKGKAS